jgi:glyoxylase-like metal-dependent hydrolase (beta-lactamase superfamily II)
VQTLHGHTQALQMITVTDDIQTLIFPADLLPTAAHIPVPYVMGYDNFPLTSMEEKHKILTKAVEEKWIICFEHDAFVPAGNIKHTDKGFALAEKVEL